MAKTQSTLLRGLSEQSRHQQVCAQPFTIIVQSLFEKNRSHLLPLLEGRLDLTDDNNGILPHSTFRRGKTRRDTNIGQTSHQIHLRSRLR